MARSTLLIHFKTKANRCYLYFTSQLLGVPHVYLCSHLQFIRDIVINPVVSIIIIIGDIRGAITRESQSFTH